MGGNITASVVLVAVFMGGAARAGADTYSVDRRPDGGIQFSGRAPALEFHKTSYRDGHFTFEIVSGRDHVTIRMNRFALAVTRNGRALSSATDALDARELSAMRGLLSGSAAVARYRHLAAAIQARHDQSPEAYGVMLGDAVVGWLGGEAASPARLAPYAARLNALAAGRAGSAGSGMVLRVRRGDCWGDYESALMNAESDMNACFAGAAQQSSSFWQWAYAAGCSAEYLVRADGYWFQYLSCSAYPLRAA